jgi:hypothetical protein
VGGKHQFISAKPVSDVAPQLITHVETTRAGINDEKALASIHAGLEDSDLLPDQHLVDAGYVDAANLLQSRDQYEVDLRRSRSSQLLVASRYRL